MPRSLFSGLTIALVLCIASRGAAQDVSVLPESKVMLLGGSNLRDWACETSTFVANIGVDSSAKTPIQGSVDNRRLTLSVTVPVRSLQCGRKRMNEDLSRALKADAFPHIEYVLRDYELRPNPSFPDSVRVRAVGDLTVAGTTKRVEFDLLGTRNNGAFRGEGGVALLMTDFGVSPPTALFGLIRTKNAIRVNFVVAAVVQRDIASRPVY
jgi:hypothetical protein